MVLKNTGVYSFRRFRERLAEVGTLQAFKQGCRCGVASIPHLPVTWHVVHVFAERPAAMCVAIEVPLEEPSVLRYKCTGEDKLKVTPIAVAPLVFYTANDGMHAIFGDGVVGHVERFEEV